MTEQLERLLTANKELQDNVEVLQTELGRKQVEYEKLQEERYTSSIPSSLLDHCRCPNLDALSLKHLCCLTTSW